jgi:hypothetical protein
VITIEFCDEDKAALNYECYNHPHPFVQRKMEAVWLKSQGLATPIFPNGASSEAQTALAAFLPKAEWAPPLFLS